MCTLYFTYFFNLRALFVINGWHSDINYSLFKVGLPDEKGEHCEVKKEEKIELSKYIDVLIQIQHSVNVYYIQYTITEINIRCKVWFGKEGKFKSCMLKKYMKEFAGEKIMLTLGEIFLINLTWIVLDFIKYIKSE